jgi:branched-chain amino acid transport system ATP-binding protein
VTEAAADRAEPILRLRGVGRRFGGVHAVRDVDLDVSYGERRAILGPNGAGKTTLFNLVAGDFAPTTGTIEVTGQDVTGLPARLRPKLGLARTYQKTRLFPGLSVADNIVLALVGHGGGRLRIVPTKHDRDNRERAQAAAERVWLGAKADTLVRDLSHGEQRQLEVGMASAVEPRLMLLDEPASGLSRGERERLTELLLGLDPEVTLILIEHDMDVALTVAEFVTMMHDGRKVVEGTPAEIRANEMVHDIYLGSRFHEEHE